MYISTLATSLEFQFCIFKLIVITRQLCNKHLKCVYALNLTPEFLYKNCSEDDFHHLTTGRSIFPFAQAICLRIILDAFFFHLAFSPSENITGFTFKYMYRLTTSQHLHCFIMFCFTILSLLNYCKDLKLVSKLSLLLIYKHFQKSQSNLLRFKLDQIIYNITKFEWLSHFF